MIELKPCPFCGGKAKLFVKCNTQRGITRGYLFGIHCTKCDITTQRTNYTIEFKLNDGGEIEVTKDERPLAIEAWNRRADNGVTAQEWISVKDMLPKNDEIVIICTDKNFIYAGELIGDTWFLDNDSWAATVTHWMPLPQPPKGE